MRMRHSVCAALCLLLTGGIAGAEVFTGTNPPNSAADYVLNVGSGVTNLSLSLPGSANAYSWVLVRRGSPPTDTVYDFSSRLNEATNSLYLEAPEVAPGTLFLRVRTPETSSAHTFALSADFNVSGFRTAAKPVTKTVGSLSKGVCTNGGWQYFRLELTSNTMWRVLVDATNQVSPDLYVNRGQLPTTISYLKRSTTVTNDLLSFTDTEGTPGVYYVGVLGTTGPNTGTPYSLRTERISPVQLNWDPGLTHSGTLAVTNVTGEEGDYYFRISPQNPAVGAWRTALQALNTNGASLYMSKGALPTPWLADFKAEGEGSKGFVLSSPTQFQQSQVWYIMVRAKKGAKWTLVSGDPFVMNLGSVAADESTGSGPLEIGPEGIRFFRASAPPEMLAWRLWLNGQTNQILVKVDRVPLPSSAGFTGVYDLNQLSQMLVVPPYLNARQYFVAVVGKAGSTIELDSRHQPVFELAYGGSDTRSVTGFGYVTYRVTVPPNEVAWQLQMPALKGNPNMAVRRSSVPNENLNEAFSELAGTNADNITLVPDTLSDGTFYVTVYSTNLVSTNSWSYNLLNGSAAVTQIAYADTVVNDDPSRVGWRYYRINIDEQQKSSLGWDISLENAAPGTRIALRRNRAPSLWSYRNNSVSQVKYYDMISNSDFLQSPDQETDIWYLGVYNPTNALGAFVLHTGELQAAPLSDNQPVLRENAPNGRWEFFRIQLQPEDLVGENAIAGWDLRIKDVAAGFPNLIVRKERMPNLLTRPASVSPSSSVWPTGAQWAADKDWTQRSFNADGSTNEDKRILAMGVGRPLQPGTYYIGVQDTTSTNPATYTLLSRWIGKNRPVPVTSVSWSGSSVTNTIAPREAAYYTVDIPPNSRSWKVRLRTLSGEAMLIACTNPIPNVASEKRMQKLGNEHYVMLPTTGNSYLPAGKYTLTVIGEGVGPSSSTRIGTDSSTYVLETLGAMPETELLFSGGNISFSGSLQGGESAMYHFHPGPTVLGFWLSLEDRIGNPWMVSRPTLQLPDPGASEDRYGNEGGMTGDWASNPQYITVAHPFGDETLAVKARSSGGIYPDASYTVNIKEILPDAVGFDGGVFEIVNRPAEYQFFAYIDVPSEAFGWDLRLTDITSGTPRLVVARDVLPGDLIRTGWLGDPFTANDWPSGARLPAITDYTGRRYSPESVDESGTILTLGRGRPLKPGRYYVGVLGTDPLKKPVSCSLVSRGIGPGFSIPVRDLNFAGGQATVTDVQPREAAYFKVEVPQGAANWKVQLSATAGESMLIALKGVLPNVGADLRLSVTNSGGRRMQKVGDEHFLLLPPAGQNTLAGGTYYLAAISEGEVTNKTHIGVGSSTFTVTSFGESPVKPLGQVGDTDIVETDSLNGGEVKLYSFSVPSGVQTLQLKLENRVGNPVMALKAGLQAPDPGTAATPVLVDSYGNEGGEQPGADVKATFLPLVNPSAGQYMLAIKARGTGDVVSQLVSNAVYTLRITTSETVDLDFEGTARISAQGGNGIRYFRVNVPTNAAGWDLRLVEVNGGSPKIAVRRDSLPGALVTTSGWNPGTTTKWPSTNQWAPTVDWTKRSYSVSGTNEDGRMLAMGINRPLEPGTYYIMVTNTVAAGTAYTLQSRGIGDGFTIPIVDLPFSGTVSNFSVAPREAAYYRVVVPTNAPSWKVRLAAIRGESMLAVLRGGLPNFNTVDPAGDLARGKGMQRGGNEHFLQLPIPNLTNVTAGTNYIAVISEGENATPTKVGSGTVDFALTSGPMGIKNLGQVTSEDLLQPDSLEAGESKAYQFTVPRGTYGFRVLLEDRVGNPVAAVLSGNRLPDPGYAASGIPADGYGNEGGTPSTDIHGSIVTIPNPTRGLYTVIVKARSGNYSDAKYTLRVQEILAPVLNFSASQNTNGLNNGYAGTLQDNQRVFFKFDVPEQVDGNRVIGWALKVAQTSGTAFIRARRNQLPSDSDAAIQMPFTPSSAVIAPPFLTNGTWFVEVRGSNSTSFTLTSSALELERPAWKMPLPNTAGETPGVELPFFGDTAVDPNGEVLSEDGVLLEQGASHYYAIDIPEGNLGLLRAELRSISGNPDLYLRTGDVPTLSHSIDGKAGSIVDRSMLAAVQTEYANWVPLNGKTEAQLKPGLWYLSVRANGSSNARYRLLLSTGNIIDLPIHGSSLTNQLIVSSDWQYYRIQMPTAVPLSFDVKFTRDYGDVTMYLRDTIPPGNGISSAIAEIRDWQDDAKNTGPYTSYTAAGTYTFNAPPVRPGSTLYLGFRAGNQANISLSVTTNGAPVIEPPVLDFYTGAANTNLAPYSAALYRVEVPAEASRWKHISRHATNVSVFLDQGTVPTRSAYIWKSTGANAANSTNNTPLVVWNTTQKTYVNSTWPWIPGQSYFLLATNNTALPQEFVLEMRGRNAVLGDPFCDDNDMNDLPDVWEMTYFGRTGQIDTADPDHDGVTNGDELLEGTDPNNSASYQPRLDAYASYGSIDVSPALPSYEMGSRIQLWAIAEPGYSFVGWSGDATGLANPITVTMDTNKTIMALFKGAGDDFHTAIPVYGMASRETASNVGYTKETGEPYHAGNPGGKSIWWTWTAPASGLVTLSTAGSSFPTLLAVYTGLRVDELILEASDANSLGGTNRSNVEFVAEAGTTYHIAVDGQDGAAATVKLSLTMSGVIVAPILAPVQPRADGSMRVSLTGEPGRTYVIEESEDMQSWRVLGNVTISASGTGSLSDPDAIKAPIKFYRARVQ